jgi:hypothetical protein
MPRTQTRTSSCSAREHATTYIYSLCSSLVVSSLPSSHPPVFFVVCRSNFNVVPFVGPEDKGAEGTRIGRALTAARQGSPRWWRCRSAAFRSLVVSSSLPFPHPPDFFIVCGSDLNIVAFCRGRGQGSRGDWNRKPWLAIIVHRLLKMKGKQRGKGGESSESLHIGSQACLGDVEARSQGWSYAVPCVRRFGSV